MEIDTVCDSFPPVCKQRTIAPWTWQLIYEIVIGKKALVVRGMLGDLTGEAQSISTLANDNHKNTSVFLVAVGESAAPSWVWGGGNTTYQSQNAL